MTKEAKTFNLSQSETNLLMFIQQHQQAVFVGALSHITTDRLGIPVTEFTQFELSDSFKELKITEAKPVTEPSVLEKAISNEGDSPVVKSK